MEYSAPRSDPFCTDFAYVETLAVKLVHVQIATSRIMLLTISKCRSCGSFTTALAERASDAVPRDVELLSRH